jgi:nicotinate-nucleotide adenylyltransferase
MGADNLAEFHKWQRWRFIARQVPIAVIARPGYDRDAHASPAMGWLRRAVRPAGQAKNWTRWRLPALVLLRFRPDPTSATRLRAADPAWHRRYLASSPSHSRTDQLQP